MSLPVEARSDAIVVDRGRVARLDGMLDRVQATTGKLEGIQASLHKGRKSPPDLANAYLQGRSLLASKSGALPPEFLGVDTALGNAGVTPEHIAAFVADPTVENQSLTQVLDRFGNPLNPDAKLGAYPAEERTHIHEHVVFNGEKPLVAAWKEEVDAEVSDLQRKELTILELSLRERGLLTPFATAVDRFYANGKGRAKTQIIPDTLNPSVTGPVLKIFHERGVLEQDPTRLGLHEDDPKQKRALDKVHESYEAESKQARIKLYGFIHEWLGEHPDIEITQDKITSVDEIIDIVYDDTLQISESSLHWTALYALESVFGNTPDAERDQFSWNVSIGGDQVPPPYVESYIVEPLNKLTRLQQMKDEGKVGFVPELDIVATYHSQVRENKKDKAGHEIDRDLHVYNSRVTVERLHQFVDRFYPQVRGQTRFVELPDYDQTGSERLLYAILWKRIAREGPMTEEAFAKMFNVKGDVQTDNPRENSDWGEDSVVGFFKEEGKPDVNPYVIRHVISTMMFTRAHTLRWGARRTEPQFHVVPMQVLQEMRRDPDGILQEFARDTEHFEDTDAVQNIQEVRMQLAGLPDRKYVHGQNGMNVHASYYHHRDESTLERLAFTGNYSADRLRYGENGEEPRPDKADEMEATFKKVTQAVGHRNYIEFLREVIVNEDGERRYAPYDVSPHNLSRAIEAQGNRMESYLIQGQEARELFQFYLN